MPMPDAGLVFLSFLTCFSVAFYETSLCVRISILRLRMAKPTLPSCDSSESKFLAMTRPLTCAVCQSEPHTLSNLCAKDGEYRVQSRDRDRVVQPACTLLADSFQSHAFLDRPGLVCIHLRPSGRRKAHDWPSLASPSMLGIAKNCS